MRTAICIVMLAVFAAALVGCKSKAVSRVYPADMDTTWAAVLRVVENASEYKPVKVDRENGKIITGPIYGDVRHEHDSDTFTSEKAVDVWRTIISCKPEEAGTKVTVRIQKGTLRGPDDPRVVGTQRAGIGYTLWEGSTDWQKKFLDDVAAELEKK